MQDFIRAIKDIWVSTGYDYSDIYTLLITPFIILKGDSRIVYISALAVLYLIPFLLIMGALSAKLILDRGRHVFWSATFLSLFMPALWIPTLYGYPDIGAAALFALALLLYVSDPKLSHWWQIILIGLFISLSILFRRHYAYDAISFFVTISLITIFLFIKGLIYEPNKTSHEFSKYILRIGFTVFVTVLALAIIGWPFINRVLNTDFRQIYSSWYVPYNTGLFYYTYFYGWGIVILALLGFILGIVTNVLNRFIALFFCIFTAYALTQWIFFVKQLGIHYTLHFTTWIILGLVAFLWTVWIRLKGKSRAIVVLALIIFLSINAAYGLMPFNEYLDNLPGPGTFGNHFQKVFSANYPPQRRDDYGEIVRLVDYMHDVSVASDPIYVVASSGIINDDILWHANRSLYEDVLSVSADEFWDNKTLDILHWIPFADSKHPYPLEQLLYSEFIIVANPFQKHLESKEHDVLKVAFEIFSDNWEFAKDFIQLPEEFNLNENVEVRVYKRIRPTSLQTSIHTLKKMQDYVGERPGGQSSWIILSDVPDNHVFKARNNIYHIETIKNYFKKSNQISLVYLDNRQGNAVVAADLHYRDEHCAGLAIRVSNIDENAKELHYSKTIHKPDDEAKFELNLETKSPGYLLLEISPYRYEKKPNCDCSFTIDNLKVSYKDS
ncbi:MAG: hypothetical protein WBD99_15265 [Thermodesulfobacteriota bacterium]